MKLVERARKHPAMIGATLATLILFAIAGILSGFELLHFGTPDKVVRVVIFPDQPGFWERYQTLMAGLFAAVGGASAIVGGMVASRGQIRAAEIDRDLALTRLRQEREAQEAAKSEAEMKAMAVQRSELRNWASRNLGKIQTYISLLEKYNTHDGRIVLEHTTLNAMINTLRIIIGDNRTSTPLDPLNITTTHNDLISRIDYSVNAAIACANSAQFFRNDNLKTYYQIEPQQAAQLIQHIRGSEGALAMLTDFPVYGSDHLNPPQPETAPKG